MPGLPSSLQATFDVFKTLTGLKIEPAAPVPSSATTLSSLAVQGAPGVCCVVVVVVVEEVLVVDVVAAGVVEVVVVVVVVVVPGTAVWEQPATNAAEPSITTRRVTAADLERRMSLLAVGTSSRARARADLSDADRRSKYGGSIDETRVNRCARL